MENTERSTDFDSKKIGFMMFLVSNTSFKSNANTLKFFFNEKRFKTFDVQHLKKKKKLRKFILIDFY